MGREGQTDTTLILSLSTTPDFIPFLLIGVAPTAGSDRVTTLRAEDREEKRTKGREHHLI